MKLHTTNYNDTFIEVAEDCSVKAGEVPPIKGEKRSVANIQYEIISKNPYQFTSDDVLFRVYAEREGLSKNELETARKQFFSKGQPCFRSSPLTKRYGWGVHSDKGGKIALYGVETVEYKNFSKDTKLRKIKALKTKR